MFVQHHSTHLVAAPVQINHNKDFDLWIDSKINNTIKGRILFAYLEQSFESQILITPSAIQIQSTYPYAGILASAPSLSEAQLESPYLFNGSLTQLGVQNIVWLILDTIHLYNVVRLKPNSILSLYRETFNQVKGQDPELIFGKIQLNTNLAQSAAKFLAQKAKQKYKYVYGNPLDLLASLQHLLSSYPPVISNPTQASLTRDIVVSLS
jgi:hypothetical protein